MDYSGFLPSHYPSFSTSAVNKQKKQKTESIFIKIKYSNAR